MVTNDANAAILSAVRDYFEQEEPRRRGELQYCTDYIDRLQDDIREISRQVAAHKENKDTAATQIEELRRKIEQTKARKLRIEKGEEKVIQRLPVTSRHLKVYDLGVIRCGPGKGCIGPDLIQIVDQEQMLLDFDGVTIWMKGYSTKGIVSDKELSFDGIFVVTGIKTYSTAIGGSRTVFVVETIDVNKLKDAAFRLPADRGKDGKQSAGSSTGMEGEKPDTPLREQLVKSVTDYLVKVDTARYEKYAKLRDASRQLFDALSREESEKQRPAIIQQYSRQLQDVRDQLEKEADREGTPAPVLDINRMSLGQIGWFVIAHRTAQFRVLQIVGRTELLAECTTYVINYCCDYEGMRYRSGVEKRKIAERLLWVRGVQTEGLVTDKVIKLTGAFIVADTKQYDTVLGGNKTVFVIEPIDIDRLRAQVRKLRGDDQREAAAARKAKETEHEEGAASKVRLAESFMAAGMADKGMDTFRQVIIDYPGTKAADMAAEKIASQVTATTRPQDPGSTGGKEGR